MLILQMATIIPSRQNSPAVHIALLVIVCVAIIIALRYFYASLKKSMQEEKEKHAPKSINISLLNAKAKQLDFTKDEIRFLVNQCKKNNIVELPLILATKYCIETPFKKIYRNICENADKLSESEIEEIKLYLFMLIHKLETAKKKLSVLTSTIAFPTKSPIAYVTKDRIHNHSIIAESTDEGMFLKVSKDSDGNAVKPAPFSKITLYLELEEGIAYQARTRVVRYQIRGQIQDIEEEMVVTHSKNIKFFQRRKHRRVETSLGCAFKALKIVTESDNEEKKIFIPQKREYRGEITDISASGCRLRTGLPIHAGQYMQIKVSLSELCTDTINAIVVKSGKDSTGKWCILNMHFVKMSKKTQNNIFSIVYDYNQKPDDVLEKTL